MIALWPKRECDLLTFEQCEALQAISFLKVSLYDTTNYMAGLNAVIDQCSFFQVAMLFK